MTTAHPHRLQSRTVASTAIRERLDNGSNFNAGSAELALRRHDLTPQDLQRLAHAAANQALNRMKPRPPLSHAEHEDLVSSLTEHGLRWAIQYDPNLDPHHRNFATSVYSRMRLRTIDWCRTNIHDARFGTNKRHLTLDHDPHTTDDDFQTPAVSKATIDRYRQAAATAGMSVEQWAITTLDNAAA